MKVRTVTVIVVGERGRREEACFDAQGDMLYGDPEAVDAAFEIWRRLTTADEEVTK